MPHPFQRTHQMRVPSDETPGERFPRGLGAVSKLARKRTDRAASRTMLRMIDCDDRVSPRAQIVKRPDLAKAGLLKLQNPFGLRLHNGAHQRLPVGEIVVNLRFAGAAFRHDVVKPGSGDAVFRDQARCGRDDSGAGRSTARRHRRTLVKRLRSLHATNISQLDLTVQF